VIIRNGTETILFDTPASVGEMLNEKRIFHISAIFLSHKHYDHIAGITEFEYWPEKIPVYGNISVLGNFEITDRLYEQCKFHVLHDRESVKVGRIKVTPFDVSHKTPTFGLIFRFEDKRIVHFSDSVNTKLTDYQRLQVKHAQLVIFHTVAWDGGTDHIDMITVIKIAKRYPETRFVITHIGHNAFPHDELVEKLSPYKNIKVAYDGLELRV
jgi:phosphoribosyl 1,2-cyclic phosphodiesterase